MYRFNFHGFSFYFDITLSKHYIKLLVKDVITKVISTALEKQKVILLLYIRIS